MRKMAATLDATVGNQIDFEQIGWQTNRLGEPCIPFVRQKLGRWTDDQRNAFAKGWMEASKLDAQRQR